MDVGRKGNVRREMWIWRERGWMWGERVGERHRFVEEELGGGVMVSMSDLLKQECRWEWQFRMMGRSILIGHPQWVWPEACARAYPLKAEVGTP